MSSVIVDTSVWSLVLRKKSLSDEQQKISEYLSNLIKSQSVVMLGAIRQEILSGISDLKKYNSLRQNLQIFSDYQVVTSDYERAAEFYNLCRSHGIQGSHTDYLICSVAYINRFPVFTLDGDFMLYRQYIDIGLIDESVWNIIKVENR